MCTLFIKCDSYFIDTYLPTVRVHLKLTGNPGACCSAKSFGSWKLGGATGASWVPEERVDQSIRHGTAESISQWSGHAVVPFIAKYRFPICHSLHTGQWTNCLMIVGDHNLLIFVIPALGQGSHSTRQMDHWSNIGLFRWQLCYWVCLSHWHLGNSALSGSRWSPQPSAKHTQRSHEAKITQQWTVLRYNANTYVCLSLLPIQSWPSWLCRTSPSMVHIAGNNATPFFVWIPNQR